MKDLEIPKMTRVFFKISLFNFPGNSLEANMPISLFLNENTLRFPSQINFEIEGSEMFCSCAL